MTPSAPPRKRVLVAHPIFFGLFPLFSMLSANLVSTGFGEIFLPATAVLGLTAALWVALWPLLPQPAKRGLALSLFWLPFYGYGMIVDTVRRLLGTQEMAGLPAILGGAALLLFVTGTGIYLLRVSAWRFEATTRVLNHVSAITLGIALAACGIGLAQRPPAAAPVGEVATPDPSLPNIYYIICDAYPRADLLQRYFAIDNTPFLNQLRDRGFYIAGRSRSNYGSTHPSMASALNLDYIDPALIPTRHFEADPALYNLVRDSRVVRTLKQRGYEVVDLTLGLFGGDMALADRVIRPRVSPYSEYQQFCIDMTPVRSILNRLTPLRSHHLVPFVLDTLAGLQRADRPLFVYAHLYAPHVPHSYDKEGKVLETLPPYQEGMRNVIAFLNTRLVEVAGAILARDPNSVILIQGDHGSNASLQSPENFARVERSWEDYVQDRSANLSAFYFPDRQYQGLLYPEITPVNTFRIVFNKYLGMDFPLLEDVTYLRARESTEIVRVEEVY